MTSIYLGIGALAVSAGAGLYSANRAANAQENAANRAADISQQSSAAQLAYLREQAGIARQDQLPFSAGGTNAYNEFLRQLGVAPASQGQLSNFSTTSNGRQGSYGTSLVPLPGVTTTGVHSQQTNTDHNPLNPINNIGFGMFSESKRPGTAGGSPALFYDPGSHTVVDGSGQTIAAVPQNGGAISGLIHGFNNTVRIDAQGNLVSVGSRGENPLNIRLSPLTEAQRAAAQQAAQSPGTTATGTTATTGATATDPANRYGAYFSSPGYQFLYDETMRAAKASGASRGSLYSGAMLKELQNRAAGVASQDYGAYMTRLEDAARVGQAAASGTAATASNLGANGATIIGSAGSDRANAQLISGASQASSIIGANNTFQSTLGSGLTALGNYYAGRGTT